jgi:hypothetical protein
MIGRLRSPSGCALVGDDGTLSLANCRSASVFHFDRGGAIRLRQPSGDRCLQLDADGTLAATTCALMPAQRFALDEDGHLFGGVAPAPAMVSELDHDLCVGIDGTAVHGVVCGPDRDERWELLRPQATTQHASIGITQTGRAVRIGDLTGDGKADLCAVQLGGLMCAPGDGQGRFARAIRIDVPAAPLAIDATSLSIGDVDGDDRPDACGTDAFGVLCATAASGFAAARWSTTFAAPGPANSSSLAICDHEVCGLSAAGVGCATSGATVATQRSAWPQPAAALWPADLDGDGQPDWCTATATGPACGLAAERDVTTDGVAWAFSSGGVVDDSITEDGSVADAAHGQLADVSGDGRADLCVVVGGRVECAISQGHGFGPRLPVLVLPTQTRTPAPGALWLGDLDGDGKADACVSDDDAITCALSP